MKNIFIFIFIFLTISFCSGDNFNLTTDYYPQEDKPIPLKGKYFTDKNFHTKIMRITDKKIDGYAGSGIQNEYSRTDPENCNGTFLILRSNSGEWYLYRTSDYKLMKQLSIFNECNEEPEPRWDNSVPELFYYVCNTQLRSFNIYKNRTTVIHDFKKEFPGASHISTKTEGDASLDRTYWSFIVEDSQYNLLSVVVYDRIKEKIVGRKDKDFPDIINWVSMDMSGNHCLIGYDNITYVQVFSRDLTKNINLPEGSNAHGDLALTSDGKDVFVYQNNRTDYIAMSNLEDGKETPLIPIPFEINTDIGLHFSGNCSDIPGLVLVSTYGAKNTPHNRSHSWMDNQLFMVELKKSPQILRIAPTMSYTSLNYEEEKNYFAEAFATINKKGTKIYWGSNWGKFIPDYSDTYEARVEIDINLIGRVNTSPD